MLIIAINNKLKQDNYVGLTKVILNIFIFNNWFRKTRQILTESSNNVVLFKLRSIFYSNTQGYIVESPADYRVSAAS